ncbi:LuxR C-terminal-related transcriptional regulator [Microvirga yunnanensis]|uniref:LuxR C-terminal-related transcriptional regulator n=1 Tax=Microvirga yunnanensis TaxID=2953740 RepID=UPI0021C71A11|nr:response regulator transcription factor [Microvirga sp. HBU65207]
MAARTLTLVHSRSSNAGYPTGSLTPTIPTALICDNSLLRSGLQHILSGSPFVIVEAASVAGSRRFQGLVPDVALVLIEARQNAGRVLEIVRQVRDQAPEVRIVVVADQYDFDFMRLGHEAGVNGFCLIATGPGVLIKFLELVMLGESVLPFEILRSIMEGTSDTRNQSLQDSAGEPKRPDLNTYNLSGKEVQVLNHLRDGAPNKVIAHKLEITEATVKVHVKAIMRKIGVSNRTQAAMWASQRLPRNGATILDV